MKFLFDIGFNSDRPVGAILMYYIISMVFAETCSLNPTSGILKDSANLPGGFYVSWLDTSQGSALGMDLKLADWGKSLV